MKGLSLRAQLWLVAAACAAVVVVSTFLVGWRYLQYSWHPEDANQYSGMWAGGDMFLAAFIYCLFLAATFFLALVVRKSEPLYIGYSKALIALSLTAPASIGLLAIPAVENSNSLLGWVCMWRLFASPFVLFGLVGSRLLARFPRAKRLSSYAGLIEGATLGGMIVLLGVVAKEH